MLKKYGLFIGLILFFLILFIPDYFDMGTQIKSLLAVIVLMAGWWMTEAIPIPVTAFLPLVLFPILKITDASEVSPVFADKSIFLFLGGFIIALSMQKWNLHKRIALNIILLIGTSGPRIILGFMLATAFLSMWISNTATTMMMISIAIAVFEGLKEFVGDQEDEQKKIGKFGTAMMLAIAYSASIGGVGTLIGTPSNIIFIGIYKEFYPNAAEIGFVQWMMVGLPLVLTFIPVVWLFLTRIQFPIHTLNFASDNFLTRYEPSISEASTTLSRLAHKYCICLT